MIPAADQQKTDLPSRPSTLDHWRRLFRLARKELREILRDRRTIITLILMPVLVYPLLSIAFQQFFLAKVAETLPPEYVIGFRNEKESNLFVQFIDRYTKSGKPQHAEDAPLNDTVKKPVVKYVKDPDLKAAVRDGRIDLGIEFEIPPDQATLDFDHNLTAHCRLIYDPASSSGQDAFAHITSMLDKANVGFLSERLQQLNVTQRAVPVDVEAVVIRSEKVDQVVSLTSAIPLILILMTITGAVYPAIDLTAGERERGTLEILIAAPIPRIGLLIAKYIAVITVAMLTASVNLFMMTVTLTVSGLGAFFFGPAGLSFQTIVQVFCLLMLFAMFFSAVLLTLTSFARSFKEAQAYLIPLMLLSMAPGIMSLMPGLKLTGVLAVVPLVNIVLLGRDLLQSEVNLVALVTVIISTSLYALVAISIAGKIFGAEGVLYSTQPGWADLFRRPANSTNAPTLTGAMFCLACIFPTYFVISNLMARNEYLIQEYRVLASFAATGLLFGLFPAVAAWAGRVRPLPGFSLWRPKVVSLLGAAMLGLSLWPYAYEVVLLTKTFQISPELSDLAKEVIERIRAVHPVWVILSYAVVPATFEEFFFRGYLFNAVRGRTTALQTIITTALIFGLFHFVTHGGLSLGRLVNSTILGIVLGWIRWRSGSIWPGIVMHTCHNAFLLMTAYYAEDLMKLIPQYQDQEHMPTSWLVTAAIMVAAGIALVQAGKEVIHTSEVPDED